MVLNFSLGFVIFFSSVVLLCSFGVLFFRDVMYSVISLILFFVTCSFLLFAYGYEFLSLVVILVYVGAVAVLFLFALLCTTSLTSYVHVTQEFLFQNTSSFFIFYLILLCFKVSSLVLGHSEFTLYLYPLFSEINTVDFMSVCQSFGENQENLILIGLSLYGSWGICLVLSACLLLVGMVSVINTLESILTQHPQSNSYRFRQHLSTL